MVYFLGFFSYPYLDTESIFRYQLQNWFVSIPRVLILLWQELRYPVVPVIDAGRPAGELGWMWTLFMQHHQGLNHENQWSYLISEMPGGKKWFFESYSDHLQLHTDRLAFRIRCPTAYWIFRKQQGWLSRALILSIPKKKNSATKFSARDDMTRVVQLCWITLCLHMKTALLPYALTLLPKAVFI